MQRPTLRLNGALEMRSSSSSSSSSSSYYYYYYYYYYLNVLGRCIPEGFEKKRLEETVNK